MLLAFRIDCSFSASREPIGMRFAQRDTPGSARGAHKTSWNDPSSRRVLKVFAGRNLKNEQILTGINKYPPRASLYKLGQNPSPMTRRGRRCPPGHSERPRQLSPGPESSHSAQKPSRNPELCWNFFWGSGFYRRLEMVPVQTRHQICEAGHVSHPAIFSPPTHHPP